MEEQFIDLRNNQLLYDRAIARLKNDKTISQCNKKIMSCFLRDASLGKTVTGRAKKKICLSTLAKYIVHMQLFIKFLNIDVDKVTQTDMEKFIEALETNKIKSQSPRLKGTKTVPSQKPYSDSYKVCVKKSIRKFYKWLLGSSKTYPKIVDWIDTYAEEKEISALTEAEVERMVDFCKTTSQRAIIQVFFDGGFRIGELLNIRLHHVKLRNFDTEGLLEICFVLRVPFSKTLRRTVAVPMQTTTKWLKIWLEEHPAKPIINDDGTLSALDVTSQLFPVTENAVRQMIRRIGRKALKKRVYPHLLRHSSATYWSNKLPYFKFCKRFGWTMTSNMPQRYIDREGVDELSVVEIYYKDKHEKPHPVNKELLNRMKLEQ